MIRKIAIVLSGCGHQDGSEIQEAVSLIINLSILGAQVEFFAPDRMSDVTNAITGKKQEGQRNLMVESARICRGKIRPLTELSSANFDALAMPGGFGAALHLSNWAQAGAKCQVDKSLAEAIVGFHKESKPIAAICIAPTLVARVLGHLGVTLTVGDDESTITEIKKTGARHEICPVDDFVTDREHKIITTPAYMYDAQPAQIFKGISGLAQELFEMA